MGTMHLLGDDGEGDGRAGLNHRLVANKMAYEQIVVSNGYRKLLHNVKPVEIQREREEERGLLCCLGIHGFACSVSIGAVKF